MWLVVLFAAIIRGYAGFGFSAIVVASLSLVSPTREIVPLVVLLEIVASVQMFPKVWQQINWRLVWWLLICGLVFIPLGQVVLKSVPIEPMRIVCATALLLAVGLISKGYQFPISNSPKGWALVGAIAGTMNGLLAMGGMWVMILLLGTPIQIQMLRASLVAYFFLVDFYTGAIGIMNDLLTAPIIWRSVSSLPFLFLGVFLGTKQFEGANETTFRKVVLAVLAGLAMLLVLKALWAAI